MYSKTQKYNLLRFRETRLTPIRWYIRGTRVNWRNFACNGKLRVETLKITYTTRKDYKDHCAPGTAVQRVSGESNETLKY